MKNPVLIITLLFISNIITACKSNQTQQIEPTTTAIITEISQNNYGLPQTIIPTIGNQNNQITVLGTTAPHSQVLTIRNIERITELSQWNLAVNRFMDLIISPDGKFIFTTSLSHYNNNSETYLFEIRDAKNGVIIHTIEFESMFIPLAISPDSKYLALLSNNNSVSIWDIKEWKVINKLLILPESIVFTPDGKQLIGSTGNTVIVWDLSTGKEQLIINNHPSRNLRVANTSIGLLLASAIGGAGREGVTIWNLSTNKLFRKINLNTSILDYIFSPDGNYLAINIYMDKKVNIYRLSDGELVQSFNKNESSLSNLLYSPDGSILLIGTDKGNIYFWDTLNGRLINKIEKYDDTIYAIAFSPDGSKVISGSSDGIIHFWGIQ